MTTIQNETQNAVTGCAYCGCHKEPSVEGWEEGLRRLPQLYKASKGDITAIEDFIRTLLKEAEQRAYHSPCVGCPEGHPSFWKTIVESKEWQAWEKEQSRRYGTADKKGCFDYDESRECGWFSPEHFAEFLAFCCNNRAGLKMLRPK